MHRTCLASPEAKGTACCIVTAFSVGYRQWGLTWQAPRHGLWGPWPWPCQPGIPGTGRARWGKCLSKVFHFSLELSAMGQWMVVVGVVHQPSISLLGHKNRLLLSRCFWAAQVASLDRARVYGVFSRLPWKMSGVDNTEYVLYFTNHTVSATPGTSQKAYKSVSLAAIKTV